MRNGRTLLVLLGAALLPLLAPASWLAAGAFPDARVLVVVYVALRAGPTPAAWCGALLGLLAAPWTTAPLGQESFLLGAAGFVAGAISQALYRDRASVQIALVAAAVVIVRLAGAAAAGAGAGSANGSGGALSSAVVAAGSAVPAALASALGTALAAPPVFGLLGAAGLFHPRSRRAAGV